MTIAELLPIVLKASLMLLVLGVGLRATTSDAFYLFRRPRQLLAALLSMDVVVPLIAIVLASTFSLEPAVKIALVTLSLAPLPPTFSKKPLKAGGKMSYTVGLFVSVTIIAIVFIPLALALISRVTGVPLQMSPGAVWALVLWSLLAPLAAGMAIRRAAPSFAERAAGPVVAIATVVLIVAIVPILIKVWPIMMSLIGNGTVVVMVILAVLALAAGHFLGGPDADDRTVLALSSAARHPAIAIAIAHANFPEQKLAPAAILLYVLVSGIVTVPYLKWVARHQPPVVGEIIARDA